MIIQDQSRIIAFLEAPGTHGGRPVERIDSHASIVFLAGTRAYKLKRAVRYDYLDFGSVERRRAMCEAEVRINRRTAAELYLGAVAIPETPSSGLQIGGNGTPVDWVVEMVRFDQTNLLDRRAESGDLGLDLMPSLGEAIACFHSRAGSRTDRGGWDGMKKVVDGNAAAFAEGAEVFDREICRQLTHCTRFSLGLVSALLDARREQGEVRQCHGDLHLRNVVLLEGRPTLFDAIEFNDDLACVDVLYDLAFLLMDLWRRHLFAHANAVWNAYLAATGDLTGLSLMPLFLSCRAAVRAKTSASAAALQTDPVRCNQLREVAREYLRLSQDLLLQPPAPCLIAIGGHSGSGKSTLARSLAPLAGAVPGAVVLRSDRIRKELARTGPVDRLGPDGYTAGMSQRVYATLAERADTAIRAGHTAILDAVFARAADRDAIQGVAKATGVPFIGLWLSAPETVLLARVRNRVADPSDADATVVRHQLAAQLGHLPWHHLDGAQTPDDVYRSALELTASRSAPNPDVAAKPR